MRRYSSWKNLFYLRSYDSLNCRKNFPFLYTFLLFYFRIKPNFGRVFSLNTDIIHKIKVSSGLKSPELSFHRLKFEIRALRFLHCKITRKSCHWVTFKKRIGETLRVQVYGATNFKFKKIVSQSMLEFLDFSLINLGNIVNENFKLEKFVHLCFEK